MKEIKKNKKEKLSPRNPHGYAHIYPQFVEKIKCMCYNFYINRLNVKDRGRGEGMWYNAIEIARYIITRCFNLGNPVSNLKLQKMLYFLWVDFYKNTGRMLFCDSICAWQLGPVVPEVYYEYCSYAGKPICNVYTIGVESEDAQALDTIISEYISMPASALVDRTHARGTAWDIIYQNGVGNRNIIPFDLIIKKEVG